MKFVEFNSLLRVIARSETTKQSILPKSTSSVDCFATLAMTAFVLLKLAMTAFVQLSH